MADTRTTFKYIGDYARKHGDTLKFRFSVPFDLTGGSALFAIYRYQHDTAAVWSKNLTVADTGYFTVADGVTSLVFVVPGGGSFPVALIVGKYFYEMQITNSLGEVTTYLADELEIIPR